MNEIVNKFLLAGDKFMPEMHLKQPGFTYSACSHFTKNLKFQKFKEIKNTKYISRNELDEPEDMMDIKEELLLGVYKFFDKRSKDSGIRNFFIKRVYSSFKDNIWGDDLADMQLISTFNKGIRFLLCVIDIFSKYAWIIPLKDEKYNYC